MQKGLIYTYVYKGASNKEPPPLSSKQKSTRYTWLKVSGEHREMHVMEWHSPVEFRNGQFSDSEELFGPSLTE